MKISVALCTYNGEKFLNEQLDSILHQSLEPDEIIICDDASTDSTKILLENIASKKSSIKLNFNNRNIGYIKNFEKAISLCSGDIIFLCDQDDIWNYNKVEKILSSFERNPQSSYFFSDGEIIDEAGNKTGEKLWNTVTFSKKKQKKFKTGSQKNLLIKRNYVTGTTLAFRSQIKKYILPISEDFVHDHWIAMIMAFIDNSGNFLTEPLIRYRIHSEQVMSVPNDSIFKIIKILCEDKKQTFKMQIQKFTNLKKRLNSLNNLSENNKQFIDGIILYFTERNRMYEIDKKERIKAIWKLFRKGYYSRYSTSNLIALKDLFQKVIF